MDKKTAREILVKETEIDNKKISIKIGTAKDRDYPNTIYLNVSFWAGLDKNSSEDIQIVREKLNKHIKNIYDQKFINKVLSKKKMFIAAQESIYIHSVPENFYFNKKKSYILIELYLHTVNAERKNNKIALNRKENNQLFKESLEIGNYIGECIEQIEQCGNFKFTKKQKSL